MRDRVLAELGPAALDGAVTTAAGRFETLELGQPVVDIVAVWDASYFLFAIMSRWSASGAKSAGRTVAPGVFRQNFTVSAVTSTILSCVVF
jgi:hypothetical protein